MKKIRILSIDGGGIRGLIPAFFLQKIEELSGKHIIELFDYIMETSSGSIIAAAYVIPDKNGNPKYNSTDVLSVFENEGKNIFPQSFISWMKNTFGVFNSKYSNEGIVKIVNEMAGNTTLSEALVPVSVHSFSLNKFESSKTWSSFKACHKLKGENISIKDATLATSAAPSFFNPWKITGTNDYHVDGGINVNNPSMSGFAELMREDITLVSLGTGKVVNENNDKHDNYDMI